MHCFYKKKKNCRLKMEPEVEIFGSQDEFLSLINLEIRWKVWEKMIAVFSKNSVLVINHSVNQLTSTSLQIMSMKKDLKEVGLPGNRSIFINTSLCSYYRMLWSKCKRLHDLGKISNFYISSGTIKVKISTNVNPISISYPRFCKVFPWGWFTTSLVI